MVPGITWTSREMDAQVSCVGEVDVKKCTSTNRVEITLLYNTTYLKYILKITNEVL